MTHQPHILDRYVLMPRASFLDGLARMFDFTNALSIYNYSDSDAEADGRAIFEDWRAVSDDLAAAVDSMTQELPSHAKPAA